MQSLDAYITPFLPTGPGAGRVACIAAKRAAR
jgi:hypothetical protein